MTLILVVVAVVVAKVSYSIMVARRLYMVKFHSRVLFSLSYKSQGEISFVTVVNQKFPDMFFFPRNTLAQELPRFRG